MTIYTKHIHGLPRLTIFEFYKTFPTTIYTDFRDSNFFKFYQKKLRMTIYTLHEIPRLTIFEFYETYCR